MYDHKSWEANDMYKGTAAVLQVNKKGRRSLPLSSERKEKGVTFPTDPALELSATYDTTPPPHVSLEKSNTVDATPPPNVSVEESATVNVTPPSNAPFGKGDQQESMPHLHLIFPCGNHL